MPVQRGVAPRYISAVTVRFCSVHRSATRTNARSGTWKELQRKAPLKPHSLNSSMK